MLQGFYSAAAGMLMQQRTLNVIANNLANAQTPGYKSSRLLSQTFEELLQARLERGNSAIIGTAERTRIVSEVDDLWTAGGVMETQRPFDMAITGYGFFNVRGFEDDTVYQTREGQFDLDADGYLILRDKGFVLGTNNQPIQLGTSEITVDDIGNITNNNTGANMGQLLITVPLQDAEVTAQRNGMYVFDAVEAADNPMVIQGGYEQSNVVLTDELSAMVMAQRNFSSAATALQYIDQTYAKAVNIAAL